MCFHFFDNIPLKFYKELFAKKSVFPFFFGFFQTVFGFYPEPPDHWALTAVGIEHTFGITTGKVVYIYNLSTVTTFLRWNNLIFEFFGTIL